MFMWLNFAFNFKKIVGMVTKHVQLKEKIQINYQDTKDVLKVLKLDLTTVSSSFDNS